MANVLALHSVGSSIATFLRNTYPGAPSLPGCDFALVSSGELAGAIDADSTRITLYLYRVTVNEHGRQNRGGASPDRIAPLNLDLHFLLSAWAANAQDELVTLAWAVRQLHQHPVLDASSLSPEAQWRSDEHIQIVPAELPTEELMRIWDALEPPYRLSVPYAARVVRLDGDAGSDDRPVVAMRFVHGTAVAAGLEAGVGA